MSLWNQFGFQDPSGPYMMELVEFHDYALVILLSVLVWVGSFMVSLCTGGYYSVRSMLNSHSAEGGWTSFPILILVGLALPSLFLLYLMDELFNPLVTVKGIGHQWYWSYEYGDFDGLAFDSYEVQEGDLLSGQFRMSEVDNRMVVPYGVSVRFLCTSSDVIHSWSLPSEGVKVDAVPGRINQVGLFFSKPGVFRGSCTELCGALHSHMPIVVEAVSWEDFLLWVKG